MANFQLPPRIYNFVKYRASAFHFEYRVVSQNSMFLTVLLWVKLTHKTEVGKQRCNFMAKAHYCSASKIFLSQLKPFHESKSKNSFIRAERQLANPRTVSDSAASRCCRNFKQRDLFETSHWPTQKCNYKVNLLSNIDCQKTQLEKSRIISYQQSNRIFANQLQKRLHNQHSEMRQQ